MGREVSSVNGILAVQGTASNRVVFTSINDDLYGEIAMAMVQQQHLQEETGVTSS